MISFKRFINCSFATLLVYLAALPHVYADSSGENALESVTIQSIADSTQNIDDANENESKNLRLLPDNRNVVLIKHSGVFVGQEQDKAQENVKLFPNEQNLPEVNYNRLTAKEAGLEGLVSPGMNDSNIVVVRLGDKTETADGGKPGGDLTIDMYGDGLLEIGIGDEVKHHLVRNNKSTETEADTVVMSAYSARRILNHLVNIRGELKSPGIGRQNGKIVIYAKGASPNHITIKGNSHRDFSEFVSVSEKSRISDGGYIETSAH